MKRAVDPTNTTGCLLLDLAVTAEEEQPAMRLEKVLAIRRQLAAAEYNVEERLHVALDRLLQELSIVKS
jgi:hypothetical protein